MADRLRPPHRRDGVGGPEAARLLTPAAFDNAVTVVMALGGSTNAISHLIAMAGRAGVELDLDDFDAHLAAGRRCWPICARRAST